MACRLIWTGSTPLATGLWLAESIDSSWSAIPREMADSLRPPARRIVEFASSLAEDRKCFWHHALPLACQVGDIQELAAAVCERVSGTPSRQMQQQLATRLAEVEAAVATTLAELDGQLNLRMRPIREQWEARGPGLLKSVEQICDGLKIPAIVSAIGVWPARGGGGQTYQDHSSVAIEAVLANPLSELAEVTRLAWHVAQCGQAVQAGLPAQLALIPPLLTASEGVELTRNDQATVRLALAHWCNLPSYVDEALLQAELRLWWQEAAQLEWASAVRSLQHRLQQNDATRWSATRR